jgi:hypothetical protein
LNELLFLVQAFRKESVKKINQRDKGK